MHGKFISVYIPYLFCRLNFFENPDEFQKNIDNKNIDTLMKEMGRTTDKK